MLCCSFFLRSRPDNLLKLFAMSVRFGRLFRWWILVYTLSDRWTLDVNSPTIWGKQSLMRLFVDSDAGDERWKLQSEMFWLSCDRKLAQLRFVMSCSWRFIYLIIIAFPTAICVTCHLRCRFELKPCGQIEMLMQNLALCESKQEKKF